MKGLNYSSITSSIRRIHAAIAKSKETGIPALELLQQDRELRKRLQRKREEQRQRREFLKTAGGIGLGAGLMSASPFAFAGTGGSQSEIAIVGAGAGGLRTAHRLMQYGIGSTIYEANTRVGGRMYSNSDFFDDARPGMTGRTVEFGGEFISTEHTAIRNLAHQLGLQLEDVNKLSLGDEETYLIEGQLYTEADLMDEWVNGLYDIMKRAQLDAPWQPLYNTEHTPQHIYYDNIDAIDWMHEIGYPSNHWVHKLLLADLIAEYGITVGNSALNLIYLLGWNTRNSGGLPLAGTDERLHVIGGNDLIMHRMAEQLPPGSIQLEKRLVAIDGHYNGPYTLHFDDLSSTTCGVLVLALPMNLIKDIAIDGNIWDNFSTQKRDAFMATNNVSDNGKITCEFSERHWDMTQMINGQQIHQAARAYSFSGEIERQYRGYISTWEGDPAYPLPDGIMVNYNGGYEARNLKSREFHGEADQRDVERFLLQAEQIWPGISARYTGKALVSNWIDDPFARSAFTSPSVNTMTNWWGAQWETEGNIFFAGEAYDEEYWSYMNGAILSGERVALEIHQNF